MDHGGRTFATLIVVSIALYGWREQLMVAGAAAAPVCFGEPLFLRQGNSSAWRRKIGGNEIVAMAGIAPWHEYLEHRASDD